MQRPIDVLYAEYYAIKTDLSKLERKQEIEPNQWIEKRLKELRKEVDDFRMAISTVQRVYTEELKNKQ